MRIKKQAFLLTLETQFMWTNSLALFLITDNHHINPLEVENSKKEERRFLLLCTRKLGGLVLEEVSVLSLIHI